MAEGFKLVDNEKIVMDLRVLQITTHRVRHNAKPKFFSIFSRLDSKTGIIGITHDSISSCSVQTKSLPIFLELAGLSIYIGLSEGFDLLLLVAVVLLFLFMFSRQTLLMVYPNGGERIAVYEKDVGDNVELLFEAAEAIEQAQLAYKNK